MRYFVKQNNLISYLLRLIILATSEYEIAKSVKHPVRTSLYRSKFCIFPRAGHVLVMLYHVLVMFCLCNSSHVLVTFLCCSGHLHISCSFLVLVMYISCSFHVLVMHLSCTFHVLVMFLPCCCHVIFTLLSH